MKIYGYCRCSRPNQNVERQVRNILKDYPDAIILKDKYTGTTMERPSFQKLCRQVRPGDMIVFDSVSRMSRNAEEGFLQYIEWFTSGIELVFLKEPYVNTETYSAGIENKIQMTGDDVDVILTAVNEYLLRLARKQIQIAFEQAEKEVMDLRQRTKEGLETARLNGRQIGGVKGATYTIKKQEKAEKIILRHSKDFGGTLNDKETMKLARISNNTYYKYKKKLLAEKDDE